MAQKKKGLGNQKPDLIDTLTREDVYQVVLAARNKPYMHAHLTMIKSRPEVKEYGSVLEYVAKRAYQLLYFYGLVSKLSRTRPTKGKTILGIIPRIENGKEVNYALEKYKTHVFVVRRPDKWEKASKDSNNELEVVEMAPIELLRALRTRELRNLNEMGELESEMTKSTIEDFLGPA